MRALFPVLLWAASTLFAGGAAAGGIPLAAPSTFEPTGNWQIDHAPYECIASRKFEGDGTTAVFSLQLRPMTSTAWLKVGFAGDEGRRDEGDAVMVIDGRAIADTVAYRVFDAREHRVQKYTLDLTKHDLGSITKSLRLSTGKHRDFELALPQFGKVWAATQACMDDLYANLGMTLADYERVAVPPKGTFVSYLASSKPKGGLSLAAFYWVEENGRVGDCRLLTPTVSERFNAEFCPYLKDRGRFRPATDATGKPVRAPVLEEGGVVVVGGG